MEVRNETTRGEKKWKPEDTEKAAEAIKEQLVKNDPMEGKLVALKWEKDGPVPYIRENGKDVPKPLPKSKWEDFPGGFKERDVAPFHFVIDAQNKINSLPNRKLPLLVDEFEQAGFKNKDLRRLENMTLVRTHLIGVCNAEDQKKHGDKAKPRMTKKVIYLTPLGKGYLDHLKEIQK